MYFFGSELNHRADRGDGASGSAGSMARRWAAGRSRCTDKMSAGLQAPVRTGDGKEKEC